MDIKRITSGLLGFPLVLIILIIGDKYVVDIALAIIALLAMNEYLNAVSKVAKPVRWISYLSCFAIALIHVVPEEYLKMVVTLAAPTILLILFAQIIATEMKTNFKDIAYTLCSIFYDVCGIYKWNAKWKYINLVCNNSSMGNRYIRIFCRITHRKT